MSEDFPQDNASQLPTEEQQQTVSIPVVEEIGEQAVAPVAEEPEKPDHYDHRIHDLAKAEEMAHAGKMFRDAAAELREEAKTADDTPGPSGHSEKSWREAEVPYQEKMAETAEERAGKEYERAYSVDVRVGEGGPTPYDFDKAWDVAHETKEWRDKQVEPDTSRGESMRLEHYTKKLEEWTAILHDHPVSEAYKESHPDVDFSPKALMALQQQNAETSHRAQEAERSIENQIFDITSVFRGINIYNVEHPSYGILEAIKQTASEDYKREWSDLQYNPDTTVKEIVDFYKRFTTDRLVKPMYNQVAVVNALLNDIRSGRASENGSEQ